MKQGFIFYRSFADAMRVLPADDFKKLMLSLIDYALDGVIPENLDGISESMFILIRPQIDANNRRAENGKKGGRPKKKPEIEKRADPMPEEMRKKWGIGQKSD